MSGNERENCLGGLRVQVFLVILDGHCSVDFEQYFIGERFKIHLEFLKRNGGLGSLFRHRIVYW